MAALLSQIRLSLYSSRPTAPTTRDAFNYSSNTTKTNPAKRSMHQAPHQRERMAHPQTKPQQTGPRRPNHVSHNQENSIRSHPGGARALPETHGKPHHQDGKQGDADLMKSLPRQPRRRKPLRNVTRSAEQSAEQRQSPRGPRQQRAPGPETSTESLQPQHHLSNMYSMIEDHLAWHVSTSDLTCFSAESPRPTSSGTMFVDFGSNGEVEVSYRKGVDKKLPSPPVPSKITAPSKPTVPRHATNLKADSQSKPRRSEKQARPTTLPSHPSYSSRHDSVISSRTQQSAHINTLLPPPFPPPNRPLPPLPTQTAPNPQSRRCYPPQVHTTSRSVSATKLHSSSALSTPYNTAGDVETGPETDNAVYTVIEPSGQMTSHHSHGLPHRATTDQQAIPQSPYPSSRSASLAPSRTNTYKQMASHPAAYADHSSTSAPLEKLHTNKSLPTPPSATRDSAYHDTRCDVPGVLKTERKRRKVLAIVKKMLCKARSLSDEFNKHQHRCEHMEKR